jgi:hypothetical protein
MEPSERVMVLRSQSRPVITSAMTRTRLSMLCGVCWCVRARVLDRVLVHNTNTPELGHSLHVELEAPGQKLAVRAVQPACRRDYVCVGSEYMCRECIYVCRERIYPFERPMGRPVHDSSVMWE